MHPLVQDLVSPLGAVQDPVRLAAAGASAAFTPSLRERWAWLVTGAAEAVGRKATNLGNYCTSSAVDLCFGHLGTAVG